MSLGDRARRAAAGARRAFDRRRPGTTLVLVGQPEPLPPRAGRKPKALPAPPRRCAQCGREYPPHLAAEPRPVCPTCLHLPPLPYRPQGSPWAAYGRPIAPGMGSGIDSRPAPLGRSPAHDKAVYRDQTSAWRNGTLEPPPPSQDLTDVRDQLRAPPAYWWEER